MSQVLRLASWNVNGIRACCKNGFLEWFRESNIDILTLQEVRASVEQIPEDVRCFKGFHTAWFPAVSRKGYSGVGLVSREAPLREIRGLGLEEFDVEGRVLACEYPSSLVVAAYFPNSGEEGKRLDYKLRFCRAIHAWVDNLKNEIGSKPLVLTGDFNIAHHEIDLARPKANEGVSGWLPEERAWMDEFTSSGWIDTFRHIHPEEKDRYSWWSQWDKKRAAGWRIDYQAVHESDHELIFDADILDTVFGSDHCPVTLTLKL